MPNTLPSAWVKNVYSLGIPASISWGKLPTQGMRIITTFLNRVHNSQVIPPVFPAVYPQLSTVKNRELPLLYSQLYPESTVPTINPNKEK